MFVRLLVAVKVYSFRSWKNSCVVACIKYLVKCKQVVFYTSCVRVNFQSLFHAFLTFMFASVEPLFQLNAECFSSERNVWSVISHRFEAK